VIERGAGGVDGVEADYPDAPRSTRLGPSLRTQALCEKSLDLVAFRKGQGLQVEVSPGRQMRLDRPRREVARPLRGVPANDLIEFDETGAVEQQVSRPMSLDHLAHCRLPAVLIEPPEGAVASLHLRKIAQQERAKREGQQGRIGPARERGAPAEAGGVKKGKCRRDHHQVASVAQLHSRERCQDRKEEERHAEAQRGEDQRLRPRPIGETLRRKGRQKQER